MPKSRQVPREAKEVFQVSPWQDKKQPSAEEHHNTAFMPLVALTNVNSHPSSILQQVPTPMILRNEPRQEDGSSEWMDRESLHPPCSNIAASQQQQQRQPQVSAQEEDEAFTEKDDTEEEKEEEEGNMIVMKCPADGTLDIEDDGGGLQGIHRSDAALEEEQDDWLQPASTRPSVPLPRHPYQKHRQLHHRARAAALGGGDGEEEEAGEEEEERELRKLEQQRRQQQPHAPFKLSESESGLSGLCRLALLPGGHLSGHLVDTRTRRCFGLMGTRVAVGGGGCRHDEEVEFLCLTLLTFGSAGSSKEVSAAVVKTGGDLLRLEPAEESDLARIPELRLKIRSRSNSASSPTNNGISSKAPPTGNTSTAKCSAQAVGDGNRRSDGTRRAGRSPVVYEQGSGPSPPPSTAAAAAAAGPGNKLQGVGAGGHGGHIGDHQQPEGGGNPTASSQTSSLLVEEDGLMDMEHVMSVRVHFAPSVLHAGPQADQHLSTFAPLLKGRGATVTVGTMRLDGLPDTFV